METNMVRTRKEQVYQQMAAEIKAAARLEIQERGTAGISLRALARRLNITAPAVYNYFPSLDDLLTALLVDAFNALADAMQAAGEALPSGTPVLQRARAAILEYRGWAVRHPEEFQLIYGNPIPGYAAPAELTRPLAARPFAILLSYFGAAIERGEALLPPGYRQAPTALLPYLEGLRAASGFTEPAELLYYLTAGWARVHGMVMLELFQHTQGVIGQPEVFYQQEVDLIIRSMQS